MVSVEHGMITTKGLPNSRRRARTRGSSLKGGLVTTHSPRSCSKKSTSSWMTSDPSSVEGFPEGEVARDVGAHVLPRGEGGHVVVVFYHLHYNRKFNSAIEVQLSHVRCHQHTIFLFAFFFHSSIYVIALENISEPVKHARDGGNFLFGTHNSPGREVHLLTQI